MARVLGIGGVFYKAEDPKTVSQWYARVLGFEMSEWGGATFATPHAGQQQWSLFPSGTSYFAPSEQPFMINLVVDDLDAMLARAVEHGVELLGRQDEVYGKFAWIMDPVGVKIELWQPPERAGA